MEWPPKEEHGWFPGRYRSIADWPADRLLTLGDLMDVFPPDVIAPIVQLCGVGYAYQMVIRQMKARGEPIPVSKFPLTTTHEGLLALKRKCEALGMKMAAELIEVMAGEFPDIDVSVRGPELMNRMLGDFKKSLVLMTIPAERAVFWHQPNMFGEAVSKRFAPVADDIEEAGNCFTAGRYTAAVFHLMRVIEAGVIALGEMVGIDDPKGPSWNSVLTRIETLLDKTPYPKRSVDLQRATPFLSEILPQLHAIQRAWRNKVMHFETKIVPTSEYTQDKATAILVATNTLMRRLAEELGKL